MAQMKSDRSMRRRVASRYVTKTAVGLYGLVEVRTRDKSADIIVTSSMGGTTVLEEIVKRDALLRKVAQKVTTELKTGISKAGGRAKADYGKVIMWADGRSIKAEVTGTATWSGRGSMQGVINVTLERITALVQRDGFDMLIT